MSLVSHAAENDKRKPGLRCSVCKILSEHRCGKECVRSDVLLLVEMEAGHELSIGPGPMSDWLLMEHGISVTPGMVQAHLKARHVPR